jgi:WD40 repeat protein
MQILSANRTGGIVSLKTFQAHNSSCTDGFCSAGINAILDLNQNDLIVTGFNDGAIKIWKSLPQSPFIRLQRQLLGHSASVNCLFIYNSSVFLSSAEDGTVKLWNIKTGDCLRTLNVTTRNEYRTIFGLVTLPDGRIITGDSSVSNIANSSSNIKIWKDSTPHLKASLPTTVFNMEVVGNGKYLAVATGRNCKTCNTTVHARHNRGSIYLYFLLKILGCFLDYLNYHPVFLLD